MVIDLSPDDPAAQSLEGFLQYMIDDERVNEFGQIVLRRPEIAILQRNLRDPNGNLYTIKVLIQLLTECAQEWGQKIYVAELPSTTPVRGFHSNPNTRWNGNPGSGGGGGSSIFGFATWEGVNR